MTLNRMEDSEQYDVVNNHDIEYRIQLQNLSYPDLSTTHYLIMINENTINIYLDCPRSEVENATLKLNVYYMTYITK